MQTTPYTIIYITCANEAEAELLAESLVAKNLVACANYFPIKSVYRWGGKVEKAEEYALVCKTRKDKFEAVEARVKELHSYEVPAILAFEIMNGNDEFLKWIDKNT